MCGIVGIAAGQGGRVPGEAVAHAMNAQILHRGPDEGGVHREDAVLLGMRRLSIIDVAGGHQPMRSADGRHVLVFNGEIYNHAALRRELAALGHRFTTRSDSEVVLHACIQWGEDAFARLEGMFAIACWDRDARRLLLARDRLGKKPLFVHRGASGLAFASELKSLLAIPGFQARFDTGALPGYLAFGYVPSPGSALVGVERLPAAHVGVWEQGRWRQHAYWRLAFQPAFQGSEAEAEEALAGHIDRAVGDRLMSDVPFGAFLSGGLDSSVVVARMAAILDRPVKTFTIGFREARFNELDSARAVARHLGTEHHEELVEVEATALAQQLAWHLDEPFADSSALPTFLVSRLAARHVKMVLSGDGGDEAFAGYDRYLRWLRLSRLGPLRGPVAGLLSGASRLLPGHRGFRAGRIAERLRQPWPDCYLSGVALSRPEQACALIGEAGRSGYASLHPLFEAGDARHPLDRIVAADIGSYLLDDILVKLDRMTMAASIEGRAPLLDHRLMEFAVRLPPSMRVRGGRGKHLLRQVARRWLPPEILDKPKQGFAIPLADWFRGGLGVMAADLFADRQFRERGWVRPEAVQALARAHAGGAEDHSESLWQVLMLELWARAMVDRREEAVAC